MRLLAVLLLTACSGTTLREVCNNGIDDDGNGKTDCDDADCAGTTSCDGDAGYWGPCAKCGTACTRQSDCISESFLNDQPTPQCASQKCQQFNERVQTYVELDLTNYSCCGNLIQNGSWSVRLIKKSAQDGSPVTCQTVSAAAMGTMTADADQIERSARFQLLSLDTGPLPAQFGNRVTLYFVNMATGSDFLIWLELWSLPRDATTHLPTGRRWAPLCIESGPNVAPLTSADACFAAGDAGTCRRFAVQPPFPM